MSATAIVRAIRDNTLAILRLAFHAVPGWVSVVGPGAAKRLFLTPLAYQGPVRDRHKQEFVTADSSRACVAFHDRRMTK
ncbi:hypothetical protein NRB_07500 [Novosphingobium sp. 11B]